MVLGERCNENGRNGKRSRGPSPNGHGSPDSSSEDENAEKIRVGRDYQAVCPELESPEDRRPELMADRALLVWSPTIDISDCKLDEYITVAKDKYGYNGEQALGMLFWHKHDLNRATLDLGNFTPFPDEWTVEDKVLFEQAFQFHGKSFHRIRQMLPDKNIAALVKYYYSWKKTRVRTSLMDRGAPGPQQPGQPRQGSEDGHSDHHISDKDSDNDDKKWSNSRGIRRGSRSRSPSSRDGHSPASGIDTPAQADAGDASSGKYCTVCGILCMTTTAHDAHNLCQTCYNHLRRTGQLRPVGGCGSTGRRQQRFKHRLPRGIYINQDDLFGVAGSVASPQASERPTPGETMLLVMDREIVSLKRQVQQNKQQISSLKRKCSDGTAGVSNIEELRPGEPQAKINARWHNDELLMAVQGVRKYGKDYAAIAETIGTKTEGHVRSFFASYRRRYNLDAVLREYEAERGTTTTNTTNTTTTPGDSQVNGHNASNNGSGGSGTEDSSEPASSAPSVATTPTIIKDDKMEVDSEGCALGAPAEQGGAPTTPSKQPKTATK